MKLDIKKLELLGWTVECESPLEIRHTDGSFATLNAAEIVVENLEETLEENLNDLYRKSKRLLTGKELRFAAQYGLPVYYQELNENPMKKHKNYKSVCIMEKANIGHYIGNSDIDVDAFEDDEIVKDYYSEVHIAVYAVKGVIYE